MPSFSWLTCLSVYEWELLTRGFGAGLAVALLVSVLTSRLTWPRKATVPRSEEHAP